MGRKRKATSTVIWKRHQGRRPMVAEPPLLEEEDISHIARMTKIVGFVWDGICHFYVTLLSYNYALFLSAVTRQIFRHGHAEENVEPIVCLEKEEIDGSGEKIDMHTSDDSDNRGCAVRMEEIGGIDATEAYGEKKDVDIEINKDDDEESDDDDTVFEELEDAADADEESANGTEDETEVGVESGKEESAAVQDYHDENYKRWALSACNKWCEDPHNRPLHIRVPEADVDFLILHEALDVEGFPESESDGEPRNEVPVPVNNALDVSASEDSDDDSAMLMDSDVETSIVIDEGTDDLSKTLLQYTVAQRRQMYFPDYDVYIVRHYDMAMCEPLTLRQMDLIAGECDLDEEERASFNEWIAKSARDQRSTRLYEKMYGRRPTAPKDAPPSTPIPERRGRGRREDRQVSSSPTPFILPPDSIFS